MEDGKHINERDSEYSGNPCVCTRTGHPSQRIHFAPRIKKRRVLEHHRLISSILHQAEKEMYVMYNAAERATPPKAEKKKPDYYQPDELTRIIHALDCATLKWKAITP